MDNDSLDSISSLTDQLKTANTRSYACIIARSSFDFITQRIEEGFDIASTCIFGCSVHRLRMRWCKYDRDFIQTFLNYHSADFIHENEDDSPTLDVQRFSARNCISALSFLKLATDRQVVFYEEGDLYEHEKIDEGKIYIRLPVIMRQMYEHEQVIKFCHRNGFFDGTEQRIVSFLKKEFEQKTKTFRNAYEMMGSFDHASNAIMMRMYDDYLLMRWSIYTCLYQVEIKTKTLFQLLLPLINNT
jgi:hypothetical protein